MEEAIIHLSDNRGHLEGEWMRSRMTFNFGTYNAEHREPFGSLQLFNEDTLAAGKSLQMLLEENTEVIIIPIVGTIAFKAGKENETYIHPGQVQLFSAATQSSYTISNPFEKEELVNFLQIWLYKNKTSFTPKLQPVDFDLSQTNQLQQVISETDLHQSSHCYIGKFDGRKKGVYQLQNNNHGIYAFVIEGVFEVQDRLLHTRDGLAIWNTNEIDFEALSSGAILLVLEVPL